eukprot:986833-Rhodomonas_salina.2
MSGSAPGGGNSKLGYGLTTCDLYHAPLSTAAHHSTDASTRWELSTRGVPGTGAVYRNDGLGRGTVLAGALPALGSTRCAVRPEIEMWLPLRFSWLFSSLGANSLSTVRSSWYKTAVHCYARTLLAGSDSRIRAVSTGDLITANAQSVPGISQ